MSFTNKAAYGILPIKLKVKCIKLQEWESTQPGSVWVMCGFWGIVFKLFKVKWMNEFMWYRGNYFVYIYRRYFKCTQTYVWLKKIIKYLYLKFVYEYREGAAYGIIPIRTDRKWNELDSNGYPKLFVCGFWGVIFKLFKVNWYYKVYRYYGSYFRYIWSRYLRWRFNKVLFKFKIRKMR